MASNAVHLTADKPGSQIVLDHWLAANGKPQYQVNQE